MIKHYRISILGNAGSGKTTLATELGKQLSVPVFHLDRLCLDKNFDKFPLEEYRKIQEKILSQDNWIIDGNYSKVLKERIDKSTLVIFMNVGRLVTLPRVLKRAWFGGRPAHSVPEGANLKRMSVNFLRFVAGYKRRERIIKIMSLCNNTGVPLLVIKRMSLNKQLDRVMDKINLETPSES